MKTSLIVLLLFLASCTTTVVTNPDVPTRNEQPVVDDQPRETVEEALTVIESSLVEGDLQGYMDRAYVSPYAKQKVEERTGESYDDLVSSWELPTENVPELSRVEVTRRSEQGDRLKIDYLVYYEPLANGTEIPPKPERAWLFMRDGRWFMDMEPRYIVLGVIPARPVPAPNIPLVKDCGSMELRGPDSPVNNEMYECFYEAWQSCEDARMTVRFITAEGDSVEDTLWTDDCKLHWYTDSRDNLGFYGQTYIVCDEADAIEVESPLGSYHILQPIIDSCSSQSGFVDLL